MILFLGFVDGLSSLHTENDKCELLQVVVSFLTLIFCVDIIKYNQQLDENVINLSPFNF